MSNLFDTLTSDFSNRPSCGLGNSEELNAKLESLGESNEVEPADTLDVEALNAFTIPKKRRKKETFENIPVDSRSFRDVQSILENSYKVRDKAVFSYKTCFLVNNDTLLTEYLDKKKELKENKDANVQETYSFQMFSNDVEAKNVCKEGTCVANSKISCLGSSDLGVYLSRHADMLSPNGLSRGYSAYLVIFKIMKGKTKTVVENYTGEPLEPTPNFDAHLSKSASSSDSFESAQIYLYEYDDCYEIVKRPRQILPYALVGFEVKKDQRTKNSALSKQHSLNKQSSVPRGVAGPKTPQPSPNATPFLARAKEVLQQKSPADTIPSLFPTNSPQLKPLPRPPTPPPNVSPYKKPLDLGLQRVGKPYDEGDNGVVVWTGNLVNNAMPLCEVEMTTFGKPVRPVLLGQQLSITRTVSWNTLLTVVLNNVVTLPRDQETRVGDNVYSYYRLHATPGHTDMMKALLTYFNTKHHGAYIMLDDTIFLLLPTCLITHNLKLSSPGDSLDGYLHCICISNRSRDLLFKGRIGATGISSDSSLDVSTDDEDSSQCDLDPSELLGILTAQSQPLKLPQHIRRKASLAFPDRDFLYEDGFKVKPTSSSQLSAECLKDEFARLIEAQDKRNIEIAKRARDRTLSNRSLSNQCSSETDSPNKAALPRKSFSLESLKNQPLFAEFPTSSNRDPRASKMDMKTVSPGVQETRDISSRPGDAFSSRYSVQKSTIPDNKPVNTHRNSSSLISPQSGHFSSSQHSSQSYIPAEGIGSSVSRKAPLLPTPPAIHRIQAPIGSISPQSNKPPTNTPPKSSSLMDHSPSVGQRTTKPQISPSISTLTNPPRTPSEGRSSDHSPVKASPSSSTSSQRKSLITSLPLPPGQEYVALREDANKAAKAKTAELSQSKAAVSKKPELKEDKGYSSSSGDEMTDDVLNDIIKMRPVKDILNQNKPKESSSANLKETPTPKESVKEKITDEKSVRVKYSSTPEVDVLISRKLSTIDKEGKRKKKKAAKKVQARKSKSVRNKATASRQERRHIKSPALNENFIVGDCDESDESSHSEQSHRQFRKRRAAQMVSKKRSYVESDTSSDSEESLYEKFKRLTDTRERKKQRSKRAKIDYNRLIKPCYVKLVRLTKDEIKKWQRKPTKPSKIVDMTKLLPTKSNRYSESETFIKDLVKNKPKRLESHRHDRKEQEKLKTEKMRKMAKAISNSFKAPICKKQVTNVQKVGAAIPDEDLEQCVHVALHRKRPEKPCSLPSEQQESWSCFWSIALHYLLPLLKLVDAGAAAEKSSVEADQCKAKTQDSIDELRSQPMKREETSNDEVAAQPIKTHAKVNDKLDIGVKLLRNKSEIADLIEISDSKNNIEKKEVNYLDKPIKRKNIVVPYVNMKPTNLVEISNEIQQIKESLTKIDQKSNAIESRLSLDDAKPKEKLDADSYLYSRHSRSKSDYDRKPKNVVNIAGNRPLTKTIDTEMYERSKSVHGITNLSKEEERKSNKRRKKRRDTSEESRHSKRSSSKDSSRELNSQTKERGRSSKSKRRRHSTSSESKEKSTSTSATGKLKNEAIKIHSSAESMQRVGLAAKRTEEVVERNRSESSERRKDLQKDKKANKEGSSGKYLKEITILAKKTIKEYQDLPVMTHSQFTTRLAAFKERARQLTNKKPRFVGLRFVRSSIEEVEEQRRHGNKEEVEEYEFSAKDVDNFEDLVKASNEEEQSITNVRADANSNIDKQLQDLQQLAANATEKSAKSSTVVKQTFVEPPSSPTSSFDGPDVIEETEVSDKETMSRLESDESDWPGLKVVDVSASSKVYSHGKNEDLPELLNRQVIKSRDPRLSPDLPSTSVYHGLLDSPEEPDCEENAPSGDWSASKIPNEIPVTESDTPPTKVHVNPKFFPKLLSTSMNPEEKSPEEPDEDPLPKKKVDVNDIRKRTSSPLPQPDEITRKDELPENDIKKKLMEEIVTSDVDDDLLKLNEPKSNRKQESFDFDDDDILLQQNIGRKEAPKNKTGEPMEVKRPKTRIEQIQKERPVSRNSERSLDSLEQEKLRLEEMLIMEQGTERRKTKRASKIESIDQMLEMNMDVKPRPHMARRSAANRNLDDFEDIVGEPGRSKRPRGDIFDEDGDFQQISIMSKRRNIQFDYEDDAFERRLRLQKLKRFQEMYPRASEKLQSLSKLTFGSLSAKQEAEMRDTEYIYTRCRDLVILNLNQVSRGEISKLEEYYGHLKELSDQTQFEAGMIRDFPVMKRVYYECMRDWMRLRPLTAAVSGRLKTSVLKPTKLRSSREAEEVSEKCQKSLSKHAYHLIKGNQMKSDPANLYLQPSDVIEEVGNDAFRQMKHYLDFVTSKHAMTEPKPVKKIEPVKPIEKPITEEAKPDAQAMIISYPHPSSYSKREYIDENKPKQTGDMYSPTRPTDQEESSNRKRKLSEGEVNESKKSKSSDKKKSKKRSRSKSKDRDGKKKKEKKHKKDKDKSKKKKEESKDSKYDIYSKDSKREKRISESERSIGSPRKERRISESEEGRYEDRSPTMKYAMKSVQPEIITKRMRERAKDTMRKCASIFFKNNTLLNFANAYGYVPKEERDGLEPIPHPKPTRENTFATAWCVIQYFMVKDNFTFDDSTKELVQFIINDFDPENGFVWACLLALQESIIKDVHEYADKNKELILQAASLEAAEKAKEKEAEENKPAKNKKGDNKLLLAFRQAQKEKKLQEQGVTKTSTLSKLTPEQAAKRPAPKQSRALFKPPIAYQLERTDPDHETGVQREFYSINDIVKLSDNKLMDELVRKQILGFLKHSLEANEVTDQRLAQEFQDYLQPIVLKNVPSIRNLLNIAQTLVNMFKDRHQEKTPTPPKTEDSSEEPEMNEYGTMVTGDVGEYGQPLNTASEPKTTGEYGSTSAPLPTANNTSIQVISSNMIGEDLGKRQIRMRQDSDTVTKEMKAIGADMWEKGEIIDNAKKIPDDIAAAFSKSDDDGSASALQKLRKVKEKTAIASSLDKRIAAILGGDEKKVESKTDEENKIVLASSGEDLPERIVTEPSAEEKKHADEAKKATLLAVKKPPQMKNANKLLQAFKQNKNPKTQRHACSSNKRVTASDILARLANKERPSTPAHDDTQTSTNTQPMEIEDVSSPKIDEYEDLYQQALSKDSETLDLPMDSSPTMEETSLLVPPSPDTKPKVVIGSAAVMYKAPEQPSQGIKSLAQDVPSSPSIKGISAEGEKAKSTDEPVPPSAAALLPRPPLPPSPALDIPLPISQDQAASTSYTTSYSGQAQVYSTSTTSSTDTDAYGQYSVPYCNPNQYTEYPPASTTQTATTGYGGYDYSAYAQGGYDYHTGQWGATAAPYQSGWDSYYQQQGTAYGWPQQYGADWSQQAHWGTQLPDMTLPPPGFNPTVPPPFMGGAKTPLLGMCPPGYGSQSGYKPDAISKDVRYYVFNKENSVTKSVETFMKNMGAKAFDPYNITSTLTQEVKDIMIFIHRSDTANIHMLPNFLQLKQEPRIQFVIYQGVNDIKFRSFESILTKGGILIADDTVVFETLPETLAEILKYMLEQYEAGTPWSFKIHRKTLNLVRQRRSGDGEDQLHCTRVDELMDKYGERGVVEVLESHECDRGTQPSHAYLPCCLRLQAKHAKYFRLALFLTRMPSNEAVACPFLDQGIGVLSVEDFLQNIVGMACPAQVLEAEPRVTAKDKAFYCDAIQSTGIDRLDLPYYDPIALLSELETQLYHEKYYGITSSATTADQNATAQDYDASIYPPGTVDIPEVLPTTAGTTVETTVTENTGIAPEAANTEDVSSQDFATNVVPQEEQGTVTMETVPETAPGVDVTQDVPPISSDMSVSDANVVQSTVNEPVPMETESVVPDETNQSLPIKQANELMVQENELTAVGGQNGSLEENAANPDTLQGI